MIECSTPELRETCVLKQSGQHTYIRLLETMRVLIQLPEQTEKSIAVGLSMPMWSALWWVTGGGRGH